MIEGRHGGGPKCKTSIATGQWNPCVVRARRFVPWTAGDCSLKQRCGTTRRWKKSPPARCGAPMRRLQASRSVQVRRAIETGADYSQVEILRACSKLHPGRAEGEGTRLSRADYRGDPKGVAMKLATIAFAAAWTLSASFAYAQSGAPNGRGSTTGDPA